ncbi:unnamed protein product, partial [Chrysoparadoxa australica]
MEMIKSVFNKDMCQKHYNLTRTLGEGSFAKVKLAVHKVEETKWAIKVIRKTSLSPEDEDALKSEVDILGRLEHPNIVQLREVFDSHNNFYMVLELCTGGELFDRIVCKAHYTENEAKECISAVTQAIKYCHSQGIVHRDLKPENLLYSHYDEAKAVIKLADFGLAKLLNNNAMMTTACGTPGYVAPEILQGKPYGKEVDIWSIGVISYILLCGFPPFSDEDHQALFRAIKRGHYSYPSPFWDDVSSGARDLIDHMLVLNPENRYTAEDVLNHPWLSQRESAEEQKELTHFNATMRAYNLRRKFKATVMTVAMMNAMKFGEPKQGSGNAAEKALDAHDEEGDE